MADGRAPSLADRKAAVLARLKIASVVEQHVKLSGSAGTANRRGKCPFHQGNSASFSVQSDKGFAHCFGCQWHGDVIDFLGAIAGLEWLAALKEAERLAGLSRDSGGAQAIGSGPVWRERNPARAARRQRIMVESIAMGRWIWRRARRDDAAARRYLAGRAVPEAVLTPARLAAFRYLAECPAVTWEQGSDPRRVIHNPALAALVVVPVLFPEPEARERLEFVPCGLHVTYLNPGGDGTMLRRKPWAKPDDPDPWLPKRRMLGPVGKGCVLLGEYRPDAQLWVGEGNETVLSAMALADAPADDVGVATLSLDNLQGFARRWKNGVLPLYAIEPDPARGCFTIPGHRGAVTGLVDSDMSPLGNQLVVSHRGGPGMIRAITGAERARICGELVVKGWRAAGVARVDAMRAPLGMDFNDVLMGEPA